MTEQKSPLQSNEAAQEDASADAKAGAVPQKSRTLWGDAWKRLRRNKLAMIGLIWIIIMVVIALSADLWVP